MVQYPKWKRTLKKRSNRLSNYILYVWRSAFFQFCFMICTRYHNNFIFFCTSFIMIESERRKVLHFVSLRLFFQIDVSSFWIFRFFLLAARITFCFVSRTNAFVAFGIQWNPTFNMIIIVVVCDVSSVQLLCERFRFQSEKIFHFASD